MVDKWIIVYESIYYHKKKSKSWVYDKVVDFHVSLNSADSIINTTGTILNKLILVHADKINVVARSKETTTKASCHCKRVANEVGLKMNALKTKHLLFTTLNIEQPETIAIHDTTFDVVGEYICNILSITRLIPVQKSRG